MTAASGSGKSKFWLAVFTVLFLDVFAVLLCLFAVSSLWLDVNKFLRKMSGLQWNWVAVILGATILLLVNYGVQLGKVWRALKKGLSSSPGIVQKILVLPVFLVWTAMILALFMEAGDAVLLAQIQYHGSLLGPWILLLLAAALGYGAWSRHRRGLEGKLPRNIMAVLALLFLCVSIVCFLSGTAGDGADARAPRGPQVFKEQLLYDADTDPHYITFRIPGIVVTPKGVVVTYCEARESYSDWGTIDVYMKRSPDGGNTWEERRLLYSGKNDTVNNPLMIAENGSETLHFLYNTNYSRAFYRKSGDAGITWSKTVELTPVFEAFRKVYPWKVIAFGPGHGIQLRNGRLIAPVWLSPGGGRDGHHPQHTSTLYSDDGGKTWNAGEMVSLLNDPGMGEPVAVELSDGSVMLNMRNEIFDSDRVYRAVTVSKDGARGWSKPVQDRGLPDAVCFGSLHRYDGKTILFSNVQCDLKVDSKLTFFKVWGAREPLGVRASFDDGKTWPVSRLYQPREGGYSDIFAHRGTIYALHEQGWEKRNKYRTRYLKLAIFNMAWLKDEK